MPHIHEKIDFTIGFLAVYESKVLLVHHKKLNKWICPGGHVELDEDPETALFREMEEEAGLKKSDVEVLSEKPSLDEKGRKFLFTPNFMDIHDFNETHKHIGLMYFLKAKTNKVILEEAAHWAMEWIGEEDFENPKYNLDQGMKFYAREAIKKANL
jgi:8-oxo-dGTP diphosphatase